jgi:hypothetical protein
MSIVVIRALIRGARKAKASGPTSAAPAYRRRLPTTVRRERPDIDERVSANRVEDVVEVRGGVTVRRDALDRVAGLRPRRRAGRKHNETVLVATPPVGSAGRDTASEARLWAVGPDRLQSGMMVTWPGWRSLTTVA